MRYKIDDFAEKPGNKIDDFAEKEVYCFFIDNINDDFQLKILKF